MTQMTGAQALARSLAREGVEVVFGLPGVQIMDAYDALRDLPAVRLVTARTEHSATYMAYGYARTTGKVGAALVVPGPGALNAASGVLTAYSASTPILLISGQVDRESLGKGRGALHEVTEQLDVFRPITKWCHRVGRPEEIPAALQRAFRELRTGRPRPVEVELPWDVLSSLAPVELLEPEELLPQAPDPAKVREAAVLLSSATRPLIWAGGGAATSGAWAELAELAEALKAPVITTAQARGVIPEEHPLSLGTFYAGHGPARQAVPRADVVLAVGSRLFFPPRPAWRFEPHQHLIQVDVDAQEVGRNWPVRVGIAADARQALKAIQAELRGPGRGSWPAEELTDIRTSVQRLCQKHAAPQMEVVRVLRRELAQDAIVVSGITNVAYWANLAFPVLRPRTWVTTSYAASLGYELPAAVGASIGNPGRQVVLLCGDGGFMYGVGELATAAQEEASVVVIVFRDNAFGASLYEQLTRLQGRVVGTRFRNPDFTMLARAFGVQGVNVDSPSTLGDALRAALGRRGPTVIEVPMPTLAAPFQVPPPGSEEPR